MGFLFQQGLRNFWPYVVPITYKYHGQMAYGTSGLKRAKEIAVNPVLRAKSYCNLYAYPYWGEYSLQCKPGNHRSFLDLWKHSPIGMLRDNIPLSVFNAMLAFLSLMLGIFGKN